MSEAKKTGLSRTAWVVIFGVVALIGGGSLYKFGAFSSADSPAPAAGQPGPKFPSAATPGATSGRGTLRSSGDLNSPQSLSGKPISGQQSIAFGKVVDADGKAVPDVRVQCTNCQTAAAMALSDENGDFRLPYHFEAKGDVQKMVIVVSKGKLSSKHIIQGSNLNGLKLELK